MRIYPRRRVTRMLASAATAVALALSAVFLAGPTFEKPLQAASSAGCEGGGFSIVLPGGATVSGAVKTSVAAASLGTSFQVRGKFNQFDVVSATLGITDYAFTGVANPLDMTGGVFTPVYARKTPNHRGLTLTSKLSVELDGKTSRSPGRVRD
jgi:hypothetical protein